MVATPDAQRPLSSTQQRVRRLRELAEECRNLARHLHFRPDRERVLEMARHRDAEANQLEAAELKG